MRVLYLHTTEGMTLGWDMCFGKRKIGQQINCLIWKFFGHRRSHQNGSDLFLEAASYKWVQKVTLRAVWPLVFSVPGNKGRGELHRLEVPLICPWVPSQNISKQLVTQGYEGVGYLVIYAFHLFKVWICGWVGVWVWWGWMGWELGSANPLRFVLLVQR